MATTDTNIKIDQAESPDKPVAKKSFAKKSKSSSRKRPEREDKEFDQVIVDISRVTRVMAGGKRMRFRACVAIGDRKGRVGYAVAKGADVSLAVNKAVNKAKKNLIQVPIVNQTIPHEIKIKKGAAKILLKPAKQGTGIIAGGAVRIILDLAGVKNIVSKILGTSNKINNVSATMEALKGLKRIEKPVEKKENKTK